MDLKVALRDGARRVQSCQRISNRRLPSPRTSKSPSGMGLVGCRRPALLASWSARDQIARQRTAETRRPRQPAPFFSSSLFQVRWCCKLQPPFHDVPDDPPPSLYVASPHLDSEACLFGVEDGAGGARRNTERRGAGGGGVGGGAAQDHLWSRRQGHGKGRKGTDAQSELDRRGGGLRQLKKKK